MIDVVVMERNRKQLEEYLLLSIPQRDSTDDYETRLRFFADECCKPSVTTREQRARQFNRLAEVIKEDVYLNLPIGKYSGLISALTGFSIKYVRRLLSDEFKNTNMARH